jgi:phosphoglycolate phosphatase
MAQTLKKLVLFDIDGTLLNCGDVWYEAFIQSVRINLSLGRELPKISFSGKTDPLIVREYIAALDLSYSERRVELTVETVLMDYLAAVSKEAGGRVKSEVTLCPGVNELLEGLKCIPNIWVSSLTGNLLKGAELKLQAAELLPWLDLDIGAFGSDHWDRTQLPKIAVERAFSKTGHRFEEKNIVIIGDTIHDIRCGRGLNVRSIAVGTGPTSDEFTLKSEKPDFYFPDMKNTQSLIKAILE